jgi:hypothetical protein
MMAAVRALSDIIGRSSSRKLFVEFAAQDHRTRQQSLTGVMLAWFEHLASLNEHGYDLRNEASVVIAKKIINAISEDGYVPALPYF